MRLVFSIALLVALSPTALAQWSSDPATNLAVAEGAETQVQPKAVPTPDGGVYTSWFEGDGFDVRIQKLDAAGNKLFPAEGILVADRGFSSTQDYGLDVDAAGNALLTFRDDRSGGTDITAALVTPDGMQPWGPTGVQLTSTSDFLAAPKITGTSDGNSFVAWAQNETTHLQKLDESGVPQWDEDVVLTPPAGLYFLSDLHAQGTDAILSIHHQTGSFSSPRHLLAQKFDADGNALWGAEPLAVFDGGSLQVGNFPTFVLDGSGGAVFSWYDVAGALQSRVQRVLSDGTEAFAHNGLTVSTNTERERVVPDVAFDAATEEIYVFWIELANAQSQLGVYGQKFDDTGSRRWTDDGVEIAAPATVEIGSVQTVVGGPGAFVFWDSAPSFGQDQIFGANVSGDASDAIDVFEFDVSTTPSPKGRLAAVNSTSGFEVVVWQDGRAGNDDVYAQNVNPDGSLGAATEIVADGSFELGSPNPFWTEIAVPAICSVETCGTAPGTGPFEGEWWLWFGRGDGAVSIVEQDVTIPDSVNTLSFYLEIPIAETGGFVRAIIDDNILFEATPADTAAYASYQRVDVDITDFADGGTHTLRFQGAAASSNPPSPTFFFVDQVSISTGVSTPAFSVDPTALTFEVEEGNESEAQTVTLTNSGNGAGTFSITTTVTPEGVLLVPTPMIGTVAAGEEQEISVVADATDAEPGTYEAELLIETDDPDQPTLTVDVTIEVLPTVANEDGAVPAVFALRPSYPNPFTGRTTIGYDLAEPVHVNVEVYDVAGRRVATLVDEAQSAGRYEVAWDARSLPSGMYIYRIAAGTFHKTLKTLLVR